MNIAVSEGLNLMPTPFAAGLGQWSSTTGRPGTPDYASNPNAAFVPSDPDFGGCLELIKTSSVQSLRWKGQVPVRAGRYLRVRARIKALSGSLPSVRIAGYAANASGGLIAALPASAPAQAITSYGEVVTVEAYIGTGARGGVQMAWTGAAYGHFGLDLTGPNGGLVRIDDIEIEDVTSFWMRELVPHVDVRDHGAVGDGVTNDRAAFVAAAAEAAATGASVLVSAGLYRIETSLSLSVPVIFQGQVSLPATERLSLARNYDLPSYAAAFGSDEEGLRRGVQALFHFTDHVSFDLRGRRVRVTKPLKMGELSGLTNFAQRRVICNGQLEAEESTAWAGASVTSTASYSTAQAFTLSAVAQIASIPVGARVSGVGVGREVYVRARDAAAGTLTLSAPLFGGSGAKTLTFTSFTHIFDFSDMGTLDRFEFAGVEFLLKGLTSGVSLSRDGAIYGFTGCTFNRPKEKAITSIGNGCQGLLVDNCQFLSNEMAANVPDRTSIALNTNGNDVKLRDCRVVRFRHFAVLGGSGNIITGNHIFQGDTQSGGSRTPGIVMSKVNVMSTLTGNYIDNCSIELTNEHTASPAWDNQFSFGGLTMTGNFFLCSGVHSGFRFFIVTPYGAGHFLNGLQVSGNVFRTLNGSIARVDGVDSTYATLNFALFRNVIWNNNAYNGIDTPAESPLVLRHVQNSAATNWTISTGGRLPFGGYLRTVASFTPEGVLNGPGAEVRSAMPYLLAGQGAQQADARVVWPSATRGRAVVTLRVDNPL